MDLLKELGPAEVGVFLCVGGGMNLINIYINMCGKQHQFTYKHKLTNIPITQHSSYMYSFLSTLQVMRRNSSWKG